MYMAALLPLRQEDSRRFLCQITARFLQAMLFEGQIHQEIERCPDAASPVFLIRIRRIISSDRRKHPVSVEFLRIVIVLLKDPLQTLPRDVVGKKRIKIRRGDPAGEFPGIRPAVVIESVLFIPKLFQAMLCSISSLMKEPHIFTVSQQFCDPCERGAVHDVQAGQSDILQFQAAGIPVKGNIIIQGRIVHSRFQGSPEPVIYTIDLPAVSKENISRITAPAQGTGQTSSVLKKPGVPLKQRRVQQLRQPGLVILPVEFPHHSGSHRGLRTVQCLLSVPAGHVGDKSLRRALVDDLDHIAESYGLSGKRSQISGKEIVPAEQYIPAFADTPQAAHRRDHPVAVCVIDGIPGNCAFSCLQRPCKVPGPAVPVCKRAALLFDQLLRLLQDLVCLRKILLLICLPGKKGRRTAQQHRQEGTGQRDIDILRIRRPGGSDIPQTGLVVLRQQTAILHPHMPRPVPQISAGQAQPQRLLLLSDRSYNQRKMILVRSSFHQDLCAAPLHPDTGVAVIRRMVPRKQDLRGILRIVRREPSDQCIPKEIPIPVLFHMQSQCQAIRHMYIGKNAVHVPCLPSPDQLLFQRFILHTGQLAFHHRTSFFILKKDHRTPCAMAFLK